MPVSPLHAPSNTPQTEPHTVAQALANYEAATGKLADHATQFVLVWQFEIGRVLPEVKPLLDQLWIDIDTRIGRLDSLTKAIGSR